MSEKLPSTYVDHPSRNDRILDHKAILDTPTPLDELQDREPDDEESINAASEFDSDVTDMLVGNNPNHRDEDPKALRDAFLAISKNITERPDDQRKSPAINDPMGLDVATYGSLVVANVENPGDFQIKMQEKFAALHQETPASEEDKKIFSSQVADLAHILYGKRYEEYEQQREDLQLNPLESNPFDKQNREVDKEILAASKDVVARVDNTARKVANGWQTSIRAIQNAAARPAQAIHRITKFVSDRRLAGKQRKLQKKQSRVRSDPSLRGIDKLINNHRQTRADSYKVKIDKYKNETADPRNTRYQSHVNKMEGRTRAGMEKNLARDEAFQERRQSAEARKILRKELKSGKIGYFESKKIITSLPAEKLQRIGRARCLELAAETAVSNARAEMHGHQRDENKLTEQATKLSANSQEAMKWSREIESAANKKKDEDLPLVTEALEQAGKEYQVLVDEDRPLWDPELLAAKSRFDELANEKAFLNSAILGMRQSQEQQKQRAIRLRAKAIQTQGKIAEERRLRIEAQAKLDQQAARYTTRDEALERVIDRSIT